MATAATKEREQSVRLTEDMRRDIRRALVTHALAKREAAHEVASHKLAARLYNARYSAADRKKMLALPKGWLCEAGSITAVLGGERHGFSFGPYNRDKPVCHRVPHEHVDSYGQRGMTLEPRSELGLAVRAHIEAGEKLVVERRALEAKATGILSSVTTTARLAEVWPEVKPFLPKFEARLLPVIRRDELNSAFGLKAVA